jgi:hypothetical protein
MTRLQNSADDGDFASSANSGVHWNACPPANGSLRTRVAGAGPDISGSVIARTRADVLTLACGDIVGFASVFAATSLVFVGGGNSAVGNANDGVTGWNAANPCRTRSEPRVAARESHSVPARATHPTAPARAGPRRR